MGDALITTALIVNRVPTKSASATLEGLRPWGSIGYVHQSSHKYGKLGSRANKYEFIRYCGHSKGNVMFGERHDRGLTEVESHDVDFLEDDFRNISEI